MAISKTIQFKGITVPSAYIRASTLTIHPGNTRMEFLVEYIASQEYGPFDSYIDGATYRLEGGNPIKQAYDYLKTLEKFAGSEDC